MGIHKCMFVILFLPHYLEISVADSSLQILYIYVLSFPKELTDKVDHLVTVVIFVG